MYLITRLLCKHLFPTAALLVGGDLRQANYLCFFTRPCLALHHAAPSASAVAGGAVRRDLSTPRSCPR